MLDYTCAAVRMGGCAMRKWAILLFLAGSAWPALAARSVTVGQLEQLLDTLHGKSDGKVAQELSDLELTERVSPIRLAHWEKDFSGTRAHEALTKLADLAAFLDPPAGDVDPIDAHQPVDRRRARKYPARLAQRVRQRLDRP